MVARLGIALRSKRIVARARRPSAHAGRRARARHSARPLPRAGPPTRASAAFADSASNDGARTRRRRGARGRLRRRRGELPRRGTARHPERRHEVRPHRGASGTLGGGGSGDAPGSCACSAARSFRPRPARGPPSPCPSAGSTPWPGGRALAGSQATRRSRSPAPCAPPPYGRRRGAAPRGRIDGHVARAQALRALEVLVGLVELPVVLER